MLLVKCCATEYPKYEPGTPSFTIGRRASRLKAATLPQQPTTTTATYSSDFSSTDAALVGNVDGVDGDCVGNMLADECCDDFVGAAAAAGEQRVIVIVAQSRS